MTTPRERTIERFRAVLECLDQHEGSVSKAEVLAYASQQCPPIGPDLETLPTGGPRWEVHLVWQTLGAVKAGWIIKDGLGNWSVTESGRQALQQFPDARSSFAEAERLYRKWDEDRPRRRAWLVKGTTVRGENVVYQWLKQGCVSLSASQLRPLELGITADELTQVVEEDYSNLQQSARRAKVDEIVSFVTRMTTDDVVVATSEQRVWVGDVTGNWMWGPSEGITGNLRRPVQWRNQDTPVQFVDLPAPLPAKLASSGVLVDLTAQLSVIDALTFPPDGTSDDEEVTRPDHAHLRAPSASLAEDLLIDLGWLTEARDLLDERKQLILYGPPGTGKTFVARKLADDLVGPEQVRLVQFHPAYTYEDFFEGYRPRPGNGGTISFELQPGPLRRLVTDALEQRDTAFAMIIDEINRANLAKVFGELYFLLEYRDQAVELLYSDGKESFTFPPNIYIIGTMNTADRSIALVDSAMRRRFAFVALDPREEPTRGLLRRWSKRHQLPSTAAVLMDKLNELIGDTEFQIGPSYFMRGLDSNAFSTERLERIWKADILPLLREHYFGQWETQAPRFVLSSLLGVTAAEDFTDEVSSSTPS